MPTNSPPSRSAPHPTPAANTSPTAARTAPGGVIFRTSDRITLARAVEATQQMLPALQWAPDPGTEECLNHTLKSLAISPAQATPLATITGKQAANLLSELTRCRAPLDRLYPGAELENAHRFRNALLTVITADALRAAPETWPIQSVPALPPRGDRTRCRRNRRPAHGRGPIRPPQPPRARSRLHPGGCGARVKQTQQRLQRAG
jgi:hypothetical protein